MGWRTIRHGALWLGVVAATALGVWLWRCRARPAAPARRPVVFASSDRARAAALAKVRLPEPSTTLERGEKDAPRRAGVRGDVRPPQFKERPDSEWQGMRIDLSVAPTCESTELCPFGQVCKPGACGPGEPPDAHCTRCLPCDSDTECLRGEVCVLDHCLRREFASCRRSTDCRDVPCVLSGYSTPPRHNDGMRAYCPNVDGPAEPAEKTVGLQDSLPAVDERPPTLHQRLEAKLRRSFEGEP